MSTPEKPRHDEPSHDEPRGDEPEVGDGTAATRGAKRDAVRRQRRARVFGETLPDATRDERGDQWGEREDREGSEEWLRRQVPPHHG